MAPPKKTAPRPRVICPGCSTELSLHKTRSTSEAFIYASKTDMKILGLECDNESCFFYISGIRNVDYSLPVNPHVFKCVEAAKKERAAIKAAEKEKRIEDKKRKREESKATYVPYDPFSDRRDNEAEEAIHRAKRYKREPEETSTPPRARRAARR